MINMQVTSSVGYPPLMKLLPSDAVERATAILNEKSISCIPKIYILDIIEIYKKY